MDNNRPVMFSGTHFTKAITDENFFRMLPQFYPIKKKMETMHANVKTNKGCSSCQKRRAQINLERDFAAIVSSLDPESGKKFKEYFGTNRMVIHAVNPNTRSAYLKEI